MLERVWRKGNPLTLLVGMQTSTATMENSVEIPSKTGNRTALWSSNSTAGHTHWGNQKGKRHVYPNVNSLNISLQSPCLQGFWEVWWSSFNFDWLFFLYFGYAMPKCVFLLFLPFSYLVFPKGPGSVVWCLTLTWRNPQPLLLQIFVSFSLWYFHYVFSSVQSLSRVQHFSTPWTTARQASLSITNSQRPPKPMSIVLVIPYNHLILYHYV